MRIYRIRDVDIYLNSLKSGYFYWDNPNLVAMDAKCDVKRKKEWLIISSEYLFSFTLDNYVVVTIKMWNAGFCASYSGMVPDSLVAFKFHEDSV